MYWKLFITFAKIGAFTIGGGYAMIPLIQEEVVKKNGWMNNDEFLEALTISQTAPGLLAVNISIFIGYKLKGNLGSIVATLGSALPSFLMILLIAMLFSNYQDNPTINAIFKGIRPAVVALILVPMVNLIKQAKPNTVGIGIAVLSLVAIAFLNISPIYIILCVAIGATIYSLVFNKRRVK